MGAEGELLGEEVGVFELGDVGVACAGVFDGLWGGAGGWGGREWVQ